jgi:lipoprotein-releasing system permease protein
MGASDGAIQNIFVVEGVLIGTLGSLLGLLLGLLIANNINAFFRLIEGMMNSILLPTLEFVLSPLIRLSLSRISIFSPTVFYIEGVPVRVLLHEVFFICSAALICSALAAVFAAKRITRFKPSAIMRNQ